MPRRWRWLVPLTALIACGLPRAGASAAPQAVPDLSTPPPELRVARAAQATTVQELVQRDEVRAEQAHGADGVVDVALAQVGDGYAWGGSGPDAFDCSGLTAYAFATAGVTLPHTSQGQAARAVRSPATTSARATSSSSARPAPAPPTSGSRPAGPPPSRPRTPACWSTRPTTPTGAATTSAHAGCAERRAGGGSCRAASPIATAALRKTSARSASPGPARRSRALARPSEACASYGRQRIARLFSIASSKSATAASRRSVSRPQRPSE